MTNTASRDGGEKLQPISVERGKRVMSFMPKIKLDEKKVNFLKGLPPMVMQNGLGQTIAYLQSKEGYGDIVEVFNSLFGGRLMYMVLASNPKKYVLMQKEAIEYAGWMKKFAQAFYEKKNPAQEVADADTTAK